ncbi:MAG: serine hydrolase [Clostridiales bacterium]|nr:serine hydrolase [Clostridiales bacterium]
MKYWKRLAALGLGFALAFGQTAYAEIIISPISVAGETGTLSTSLPTESSVLSSGLGGTLSSPIQGTAGAATTGTETNVESSQSVASGTETEASVAVASTEEPTVSAEGAVLLDAATGKVLYGKNENEQFYPASITKIMTALLTLENCSLDDVVTFSASATTDLESGAVSLNITEGDQLTVEQCLYGLLLKSANEIANGLAEHISGSVSAFADLMNRRAAELGCTNTNFVNPNGLNDSAHRTTAYDMALIMRAAVQSETFRKIDTTLTYDFPSTINEAARTITMGHKMMYPSDSRYYEGIIGGKTGYTSLAGNTLVTAVERDGVRLIAVVLKATGTHYTDTKAMLDYGFANYTALTGLTGSTGQTETPGTGNAGVLSGPALSAQAGSVETGEEESGPTVVSGPGAASEQADQTEAETPAAAATETTAETVMADDVDVAAGPSGDTQSTDASWGWRKDTVGWYYIKPDGTLAEGEWLTIDGYEYWFDSNSYMATGWRNFTNGSWYYFSPESGRAVTSSWIYDGGCWYYLGEDGVLLTDTTTPDGYQVDENGILIR